MIRVGFIDRYLDNWHTNHYPLYLRTAAASCGVDAAVTAAWAQMDHPDGGLTSAQWCAVQGVELYANLQEMFEAVDAVMVMCADDCLPHEALAAPALRAGKPVYCDKTFAPDLAAATRMFDLAASHGTPLFTCSAQRWCLELSAYRLAHGQAPALCATWGPGDIVNYSIHQFEMIERAMGLGALRCCASGAAGVRHLVYEYGAGRSATFTQGPGIPFRMVVSDGVSRGEEIAVTDYYTAFMHVLLRFFADGEPPVTRWDTLEIMAMQQAGRAALVNPGQWVDVPQYQA